MNLNKIKAIMIKVKDAVMEVARVYKSNAVQMLVKLLAKENMYIVGIVLLAVALAVFIGS